MFTQAQIKKYFDKAKEVSKLSDFPKTKLGCVIVYKGIVIGVGFNSNKTSPMQKKYSKPIYDRDGFIETKHAFSMHAEIACLNSVKYIEGIDWGKCAMFIYREHKSKHVPLLAKPCEACMSAILEKGIKEVYYTTDEIPYKKLEL